MRVFSGTSVAGAQVQALSATRTSGGSYTIDSPALAAGTYTARAEQSDSAGNTGFSPSRTFAIAAGGDNTPPVVSLTSPDPGSSSADDTPLFSGLTGGAAGDLDTITVRVYAGSTVAGNPVRSIQTSRLSGNWFIVEATSMGGGTYTARSEQSDTAGNTGYSTPLTFTIVGADTTAPVVSLAAQPASSTNATPTFSGTAGQLAGDGNVGDGASLFRDRCRGPAGAEPCGHARAAAARIR